MTVAAPLQGLRAVYLGGIGPGPFCMQLLATLGADVIQIGRELPEFPFDPFASGIATVTADLKTPDGLALARSLVAKADILIEGFRPGVADRLGLGPEDCAAINPRLIYGRATGWGQDGPLAQTAGHDLNYIALSGALHAIGAAHGPPQIPLNLLGDFAGGSFFLTIGLLAAVIEREQSAKGQIVDCSMLDGAASLMRMIYGLRAMGLWQDQRGTNLVDGGAPWYAVYETADGRHIALAALEEQFYQAFLARAGIDPASLPSRADPGSWPLLRSRFAEFFASHDREELCALFADCDACVTPVLSLEEAPDHPHNSAREIFMRVEGKPLPRVAPRFSRSVTTEGGCFAERSADLAAWTGTSRDAP